MYAILFYFSLTFALTAFDVYQLFTLNNLRSLEGSITISCNIWYIVKIAGSYWDLVVQIFPDKVTINCHKPMGFMPRG